MHLSPILPEVCNRTRQQLSMRLDSELSELEGAYVAAHLARCAACAAFADDLELLTTTLRHAPLAQPTLCVQLPRRRPARRISRIRMAHVSSAAVGAVVAAVALGGLVRLDSPSTGISAFDVHNAHERMLVKEQMIERLEAAYARPERQIPAAVKAAEQITLGSSPDRTSAGLGTRPAGPAPPDLPRRSG